MKRKWIPVLLGILMCVLFSGCVLRSAEELYSLPKQPEEFYALQNQLDSIVAAGGSYSAPLSGDHRQAVQLADLDSDGQEEVLAFFNVPGEKPLKVYLFRRTAEGYTRYACIEGDGSAFSGVSYCQIDTALGLELVLSRQVSNQIPQAVSVYSIDEDTPVELLHESCTRYTLADLDGNGLQDMLLFQSEEEETAGLVEYYSYDQGALMRKGTANMTAALTSDSIRRIVCGMMQENTPAVFVANTFDAEKNTIVTDVFSLIEGEFCNVSARGDNTQVSDYARSQRIYAEDVDGDGLIELPVPEALPSTSDSAQSQTIFHWYNLKNDGTFEYKLTTFHDYDEGWYLELSKDWQEKLSIRANQTSGLVFYGGTQARFAIYALAESEVEQTAEGKILLAQKGDMVYLGEIMDSTITEQALRDAFHIIFTNWNSGEV